MDGFLPWRKILIFGVELFFGMNVILLDTYVFLQTHNQLPSLALSTKTPNPTPTPPCPISCVELIQQATASALQQAIQNNTQALAAPVTITNGVKEFFIPLGSGQTTATQMTNVPGVASNVDLSLYPNSKTVTFEASVQTPGTNQIAYIQLVDATDNYVIANSQMSWTAAGSGQLLVSSPIHLPTGNKLYQVQMNTQLGYVSILNFARIHIILN